MSEVTQEIAQPKKKGFALLSPEQRKAIASKGGSVAQANGNANRFTAEQAQVAGQKGGKSVSQDRAHLQKIGRVGAINRHKKRKTYSLKPESAI